MANMSYCMFRNTMADFRNCVDALSNAGSIDDFSVPERCAISQWIRGLVQHPQQSSLTPRCAQ
jgi:hypothetical protein